MANFIYKSLTFVSLGILAACSGGGGGGGGGTGGGSTETTAQILITPQLNCGGKDCISGTSLSTSGVSTLATGSEFSNFSFAYDRTKQYLTSVKDVIDVFNSAASEEELESCADIPTSGTFNWNNWKMVFSPATESFNLGDGSVTMTHRITIEQTATQKYKADIQFRCNGTSQVMHIVATSKDALTNEKTLIETFSSFNTSTKAIKIQVGSVEDNGDSILGYFSSSGGADFDIGVFSKLSGGYVSVVGKTYDSLNSSDTRMEYATSSTSGYDLDAINFTEGSNERLCVFNYKLSSKSFYDSSCNPNDPTEKNALVSISAVLVGNSGTPIWNTSYTDQLDITDLLP